MVISYQILYNHCVQFDDHLSEGLLSKLISIKLTVAFLERVHIDWKILRKFCWPIWGYKKRVKYVIEQIYIVFISNQFYYQSKLIFDYPIYYAQRFSLFAILQTIIISAFAHLSLHLPSHICPTVFHHFMIVFWLV